MMAIWNLGHVGILINHNQLGNYYMIRYMGQELGSRGLQILVT